MTAFGFAIAALGVALHAWISFAKASEVALFTLGLFFVGSVPYGVGALWLRYGGRPSIPVAGMLAALGVDFLVYHSVFIAPSSSTAALGLVVAPFWNLFVVMPVACLVAWGILALRDRTSRAH